MKVKEALVESFAMLRERPSFVLPMIVPLVLSVSILGLNFALGVPLTGVAPLGEVVAPPGWYLPTSLILTAVISVVSILIYGMYPSMVKDRIEKKELDFKEAFLFAYHKFWSLLGASLLAVVIIMAIMLAIILPLAFAGEVTAISIGTTVGVVISFLIGILFYYITPAIIMDDLKALAGFRKSWETGKKNYLFTLLILLIPSLIMIVLYILLFGLPIYLNLGTGYLFGLMALCTVIGVFVSTWMYIIMAYAYNGLKA
jgi:membrane-anchored glycerophosphoryl diester phosphodiesterase (GDPDase)